jgi:hypothetical protein
MLLTILSLAVPGLLGYLIVSMIVPDRGRIERFSLGFGVGIGTFTLLLFVAMALGVRLDIWAASALAFSALMVSALGSALRGRRPRAHSAHAGLPAGRPLRLGEHGVLAGTIALLACLALASLEIGSYWPVTEWDSVAEYDYRGRFFADRGDLSVLSTDPYYVVHPLATSLGHTWMYLIGMAVARGRPGGESLDVLAVSHAMLPHLLYWIFYTALLGALYSCFRRDFSAPLSALLVAVVASTPMMFEHSTIAYSNLPFAYFYCLGVIHVWQWIDGRRSGDLWLGGILLALSAWTRSASEPFVLGPVVLVGVVGLKERNAGPFLRLTGAYMTGWLPWRLYLAVALRGRREYYLGNMNVHGSVADLKAVLAWLGEYVLDVDKFGVVWLLVIGLGVATLVTTRGTNRRIVPLLLCLWGLLVWIVLFYLTPPGLLDAYARASGDRSLLSLVPLAVYALAVNPFTGRARQTEGHAAGALGKGAVAAWAACAAVITGVAVTRTHGGFLGTALASSGIAANGAGLLESSVWVDPSLHGVVVTCIKPATEPEATPSPRITVGPGREAALVLRAWSADTRPLRFSLDVEPTDARDVAVALIVDNQAGTARENRALSQATALQFGVVLQPGTNKIAFKLLRSPAGDDRARVRVRNIRLNAFTADETGERVPRR